MLPHVSRMLPDLHGDLAGRRAFLRQGGQVAGQIGRAHV